MVNMDGTFKCMLAAVLYFSAILHGILKAQLRAIFLPCFHDQLIASFSSCYCQLKPLHIKYFKSCNKRYSSDSSEYGILQPYKCTSGRLTLSQKTINLHLHPLITKKRNIFVSHVIDTSMWNAVF